MKQIITKLILLLLMGSLGIAHAQLLNTDFEQWEDAACGMYTPDSIPTGWNVWCSWPLAYQSGFFRDQQNAISGNNAIILSPATIGDFAPMQMPTLMIGKTPISADPETITGFYRYTTSSTTDSAAIYALYTQYDNTTGQVDTLQINWLKLGPDSSYAHFSFTVPPLAAGTADTVTIIFSSQFRHPDSVLVPVFGYGDDGFLTIDSVNVSYRITNIEDELAEQFSIQQDLAQSKVWLSYAGSQPLGTHASAELYNITGQRLASLALNPAQTEIDLSSYEPGIYLLRIKYKDKWIMSEKIIR